MWDKRYSQPGYAYGTKANDFLAASSRQIQQGWVLSLAEGEGRNAVYLASLGYKVTAVDSSAVGLEKAQKLAHSQGVTIKTVVSDLMDFDIRPGMWQGIVSIFCHLPPQIRIELHRRCTAGLAEGGAFILEGFSLRQLEYQTGGPKNPELLFELSSLQRELSSLSFVEAREIERSLQEGSYHTGMAAVVQILAIKEKTL